VIDLDDPSEKVLAALPWLQTNSRSQCAIFTRIPPDSKVIGGFMRMTWQEAGTSIVPLPGSGKEFLSDGTGLARCASLGGGYRQILPNLSWPICSVHLE